MHNPMNITMHITLTGGVKTREVFQIETSDWLGNRSARTTATYLLHDAVKYWYSKSLLIGGCTAKLTFRQIFLGTASRTDHSVDFDA